MPCVGSVYLCDAAYFQKHHQNQKKFGGRMSINACLHALRLHLTACPPSTSPAAAPNHEIINILLRSCMHGAVTRQHAPPALNGAFCMYTSLAKAVWPSRTQQSIHACWEFLT
eukprot:1146840-Pelagomonas_calceolata.AAC.5